MILPESSGPQVFRSTGGGRPVSTHGGSWDEGFKQKYFNGAWLRTQVALRLPGKYGKLWTASFTKPKKTWPQAVKRSFSKNFPKDWVWPGTTSSSFAGLIQRGPVEYQWINVVWLKFDLQWVVTRHTIISFPCTCKDTALLLLESFFTKWLNVLMRWITEEHKDTRAGGGYISGAASDLVMKLKVCKHLPAFCLKGGCSVHQFTQRKVPNPLHVSIREAQKDGRTEELKTNHSPRASKQRILPRMSSGSSLFMSIFLS